VVEVTRLSRRRLKEQRVGLGIGGNELCALVWIFRLDILADGPALVENESIVILK
jgi:hypothetical protein